MASQRSPDAIERLYVYSLVVALLLVLLIVLLAFIARGQFVQQQAALGEMSQRIAALESRSAAVAAGPASRPAPPPASRPATTRPAVPPPPPRPETPPASTPATGTPAAARPPGDSRPTATAAPTTKESTSDPEESTDEFAVIRSLAAVMSHDGDGWIIANKAAAAAALDRARTAARGAKWSGATFAKLALLARMLDDDFGANSYLARAAELGDKAPDYNDYFIRDRARNNAIDVAMQTAEKFADATDDSPLAMLLMAEIMLSQGQFGQALEVLPMPADATQLSSGQRLRLGRAYVQTEQFDRLADLVSSLGAPPPRLVGERDFLQAVVMLHRDKPAEALALLDGVSASRADDCLVQTWRGVAQFRTRQIDAARQTLLNATTANPTCYAASYWRGVLAISSGKSDEAAAAFEAALSAAPRYAPAWEARGALALNRGEVASALDFFAKAIESEPRRVTAHFLIAIAHAKAGREDQAASALRATFRLDRSYVERAAQVDVIKKLFDAGELRTLAEGGEPAASEPADSQPAP